MQKPLQLLPIKHKEYQIRLAQPADLSAVFEMGFESWGEGRSLSEYKDFCSQAPKYQKGLRYVLEISDQLVSSCMCYEYVLAPYLKVLGIGSVATNKNFRQKGYASHLLEQLLNEYIRNSFYDTFVLFSDIEPKFYEKLGFVIAPDELQNCANSILMIKSSKQLDNQKIKIFLENKIENF